MAARQIDPEARQARRQRVDELIAKLKAGIAQRALFDEGSLWDYVVDDLADELDGMRRQIRRTLSAPAPRGFGRDNGNALEAELFGSDADAVRAVLDARQKELRRLKVERIVERAVAIHFLIQAARAVLPEIEAAREEHWARDAAEREEAFQARVAEARAAGTLREFTELGCREQVRKLIEQHTGETYYDYNSASSLFGDARNWGVITDLEYEVAKRAYGRGWNYAGD